MHALDGIHAIIATISPQPIDSRRLDCEQLAVDNNGEIRVGRGKVFINAALAHRRVNCFSAGDDLWEVTFGPIVLGIINRRRSGQGLLRPKQRNQYVLQRFYPF